MRRGAWGPFIYLFVCLFIYLFLNLAEAAASAASMQFTALSVGREGRLSNIRKGGAGADPEGVVWGGAHPE